MTCPVIKNHNMSNTASVQTAPEIIGDIFFIEFKGQEYSCLAFKANERILYRVNFERSCLYLTKTINQHGIPFWTSIPQDLKLRRVVEQLGNQLEDHLIKTLCATTIVSKSPKKNMTN
jgi:hypothetical protein